MSNIFIDGSTRVGKDFLIDNLVEGKTTINGVNFEGTEMVPSNYSFLSQFSKEGGTDAMFINTINIVSRITLLNNPNKKRIINRSLVSDFSEYLLLALVNRKLLDGKKLHLNYSSQLIELVDELPSYIDSLVEILKLHKDYFTNGIYLIKDPQYNFSDYLNNLNSDKSKFHYYAITKRLSTDLELNELHNIYRLFLNYITEELCIRSGIEFYELVSDNDENYNLRR